MKDWSIGQEDKVIFSSSQGTGHAWTETHVHTNNVEQLIILTKKNMIQIVFRIATWILCKGSYIYKKVNSKSIPTVSIRNENVISLSFGDLDNYCGLKNMFNSL